jgi:hypothetical protein
MAVLPILSACAEAPEAKEAQAAEISVVDTPSGSPVHGGRPLDHDEAPMDSIDDSEAANADRVDLNGEDFSFAEIEYGHGTPDETI